MLAQEIEHDHAADGKATHRRQSYELDHLRTEVQEIPEQGPEGEDDSQGIQPTRSMPGRGEIMAKSNLQQQCGHADGCYHNHCHRAEKCAPARVHHDQSERCDQQTGGNHRPTQGRFEFRHGQNHLANCMIVDQAAGDRPLRIIKLFSSTRGLFQCPPGEHSGQVLTVLGGRVVIAEDLDIVNRMESGIVNG